MTAKNTSKTDTTADGLPDAAHDPGFAVARERAATTGREHAVIVNAGRGHRIRVGTAGWTDPTLTAPGVFYPPGVTTPAARLHYYASRFPMVEVDAPYYALPTPRNAQLWAERTPDDFVFDVKAFSGMTGHPVEIARLPKAIREALPKELAEKPRVYPKDLPAEIVDEIWATFRGALQPLVDAGKMGAVLLQYPRWHVPNRLGRETLEDARARLPDVKLAVEFRNRRWLAPTVADRVLRFLGDHDMSYVVVDEPQGLASSVPPVTAVTSSDLAVVRMHGRRGDQWERRGATVADKYRYLYDQEQIEEWAPKVAEVARQAKETHVVFNNCYGNYGTTNALELTAALAESA
jgi:uncharacterized protein YecE (DUF72 family)